MHFLLGGFLCSRASLVLLSLSLISCRAESTGSSQQSADNPWAGVSDRDRAVADDLWARASSFQADGTVSCKLIESKKAHAHATNVLGVRKLCMDYTNKIEVRGLNANDEVTVFGSNCTLSGSPNETYYAVVHQSTGVCFVLSRDLYLTYK